MRRQIATPVLLLAASLIGTPSTAQDPEVPYWATISAEEANMRAGPSVRFPIEWVYRRAGLPVKVVRVNQGWRLVEDPDGARGWINQGMLDLERGAIVTGEGLAEMRDGPQAGARLLWRVEPGVVGALGDCEAGWCPFETGGHKGWIRAERLWGAGAP